MPELRMTFADVAALEQEVEQNLSHGRAFVRGTYEIEALSDCVLVLVHPELDAELHLPAQAVMVSPGGAFAGVGVELRPFDAGVAERIACFVDDGGAPAPEASADAEALEATDGDPASADDEGDGTVDEQPDDEQPGAPPDADPDMRRASRPPEVQAVTRQEQLRKLNQAEQVKLARGGELSDRVALERMYGKNVWDALLSNPKLTIPEVARIARKGTVPKPLLEVIVDNASWCRASPVRRALLANHRVSNDSVLKILRLTPKPELKQIVKGTAYPLNVRDAAKKLLKGE